MQRRIRAHALAYAARLVKNVALLVAAPFIGLVYAVTFPFVGIAILLIFPEFKTPTFVIARPQVVAIHAPGLPGLPRRYAPRNDDPDCHDLWKSQ